jgi:PadR family transcriptional regulator AphA
MTQRKIAALGTTSFAILGQLAWGEATTYELVKAMSRNLRFIWPRAESRIYDEAKRLVAAGLATASEGHTGRRRRSTYAITPAGVDALREWLATAPGNISLESEALLRVILGGRGTPADLLAAIEAVRDHAEAMLAVGTPLGHEYLDGQHPQQHEVHLRALTFDYLYGWAQFNRAWAQRAAGEVALWTDVSPDEAKHRRALDSIRGRVASAEASPGHGRSHPAPG